MLHLISWSSIDHFTNTGGLRKRDIPPPVFAFANERRKLETVKWTFLHLGIAYVAANQSDELPVYYKLYRKLTAR